MSVDYAGQLLGLKFFFSLLFVGQGELVYRHTTREQVRPERPKRKVPYMDPNQHQVLYEEPNRCKVQYNELNHSRKEHPREVTNNLREDDKVVTVHSEKNKVLIDAENDIREDATSIVHSTSSSHQQSDSETESLNFSFQTYQRKGSPCRQNSLQSSPLEVRKITASPKSSSKQNSSVSESEEEEEDYSSRSEISLSQRKNLDGKDEDVSNEDEEDTFNYSDEDRDSSNSETETEDEEDSNGMDDQKEDDSESKMFPAQELMPRVANGPKKKMRIVALGKVSVLEEIQESEEGDVQPNVAQASLEESYHIDIESSASKLWPLIAPTDSPTPRINLVEPHNDESVPAAVNDDLRSTPSSHVSASTLSTSLSLRLNPHTDIVRSHLSPIPLAPPASAPALYSKSYPEAGAKGVVMLDIPATWKDHPWIADVLGRETDSSVAKKRSFHRLVRRADGELSPRMRRRFATSAVF